MICGIFIVIVCFCYNSKQSTQLLCQYRCANSSSSSSTELSQGVEMQLQGSKALVGKTERTLVGVVH